MRLIDIFGSYEEQMQRLDNLFEFCSPENVENRREQAILEALCGPWGEGDAVMIDIVAPEHIRLWALENAVKRTDMPAPSVSRPRRAGSSNTFPAGRTRRSSA